MDEDDIVLYPSPEHAADSTEGYDAFDLEYFGTDRIVYTATVEGPVWVRSRCTRRRTGWKNSWPGYVELLQREGWL